MTTTTTDLPAELAFGTLDPYFDPCPSWCLDGPHPVESSDEDRNHHGAWVDVPVRGETFDLGRKGTYAMVAARMYIRRNTLHRDPVIWLGKGETNIGFTLTAGEAEQIARALLDLAAEARQ